MTVYKGVATAVRLACSGNSFTWACRWACSRSIFITRACAAAVVMDAKAALLLCNEDFPCFSSIRVCSRPPPPSVKHSEKMRLRLLRGTTSSPLNGHQQHGQAADEEA